MDNTAKQWENIAIIVSVACAVFVVTMFLVIWCRNKNGESDILDLTTEPEYISIASAKFSKEISGTNHNGTPYVIGSLDRKNDIGDGSGIQSVHSSHRSQKIRVNRSKHHKHKHKRK